MDKTHDLAWLADAVNQGPPTGKRRPGRPRGSLDKKRPGGGVPLHFRVHRQVRAWLDSRCEETGHSMALEVEFCLQRWIAFERLFGRGVVEIMEAVGQATVSHPGRHRYVALRAALAAAEAMERDWANEVAGKRKTRQAGS